MNTRKLVGLRRHIMETPYINLTQIAQITQSGHI